MLRRASEQRVPKTRTDLFPAPSKGWVQSGNLMTAGPDQAEVLDNFIVTAQGARLRGGASAYASLGAPVKKLFSYVSGGANDLFAATANRVFDADRVGMLGGGYAELEGFTSGDWSTTQISTPGGQYLVMVNETEHAFYWNGIEWFPITGVNIDELDFNSQSGSFTDGDVITGNTSGATGTIEGIRKTASFQGTFLYNDGAGVFQNGETVTSSGGGTAVLSSTTRANESTITITGVSTKALSQVWLFKERLFFVEGGTASAWYLPVKSIGGAALELDLGSVFRKGGSLLFGATWSLDSGSGLDDVCLFFSDNGEIAVYEGTDPSSAATWGLVGVYDIGKPVNKHAFFKAGGDVAVVTQDGIIPVSAAIRKDRAALQSDAITYPIEDAWKEAIFNGPAFTVNATLWQSGTLLLVGTGIKEGNLPVAFAANARTGGWSRITGWDVQCSAVSGDQIYFGSTNGKVYLADTTGSDDGKAFTGVYVPKFRDKADLASVNTAGVTYKSTQELDFDMMAFADYTVSDIQAPAPPALEDYSSWGTGLWGSFVWGDTSQIKTFTTWQTVFANGYSVAPGVAITSNQTDPIIFELVVSRLRSETGYAL